jgi:hypothetical protein
MAGIKPEQKHAKKSAKSIGKSFKGFTDEGRSTNPGAERAMWCSKRYLNRISPFAFVPGASIRNALCASEG